MQLKFRYGHVDVGEGVRDSLERRLRFALGRFGNQIARVTVRLAEPDPSQIHPVYRCKIAVQFARSGRMTVEDLDADLGTVINRITDRVGTSVLRELTRRHEQAARATNVADGDES